MNKKAVITILITLAIVITSSAAVSAGVLDSKNSNIATHEFNYGNKATFNISDDLTDKKGAESISFDQGVSYKYPGTDTICFIMGLIAFEGSDDVESNQNDAIFEEIKSNPTSQGYETYIFKLDGVDEYEVFIDLNNITIKEPDGYSDQYKYFKGTFKTEDEAKVFVDTFKIKEGAAK